MDVSALKQQAAAREQQGEAAEAAALYRRALEQLEGTPDIRRELPLYVKAGDAFLKAGDAGTAIEMYERAAEHYAAHGSAKSILVLCIRVLKVDRKQTGVFIRFARRLFDHGHVEASRTVLVDYATRAKLVKTLDRLEKMAELSDADAAAQLEQLFAKARKPQQGPAATAPPEEHPAEPQPAASEPVVSEDITPTAEQAPLQAEPVRGLPVSERGVGADGAAEEDQGEPEAQATPREEPAPLGAAPTPPEGEAAEPEPELPLVASGTDDDVVRASEPPERAPPPLEPHGEPTRSRDVLMSQPKEGPKAKKSAWRLLIAAMAVVVVVGGGLIALNIVPLGGGSGSAGGGSEVPPEPVLPAVAESLASTVSDSADTGQGLGGDSMVVGDSLGATLVAGDSGTVETLVPDSLEGDTAYVAPPTTQDTAAVAPPDTAPAVQPPPAAAADSGVLESPSRLPAAVAVEGPILAVEGLEIVQVEEMAAGYRVVQILETGEQLELTVTPLAQAPATGAGALRVTTLPGDTAMGTVRFGDNLISARALVAADVLESLLRRIGEAR